MVSRSRPSNSAVPLTRAPRTRPMMVWVDTLLPEPDSPTMPRVFPASTSNERPRTACTMPSGVRNETRRSLTSRSATRYLPTSHKDTAVPQRRGVVFLADECNPSKFSTGSPDRGDRAGFGQGGHPGVARVPTLIGTYRLATRRAQPDIGRVELLDARHVDRVVHVTGVVERLQRVGDREDRRVLHDVQVGLDPQGVGRAGASRAAGLVDQSVDRRVVVEPEVAADRRVSRGPVEQ